MKLKYQSMLRNLSGGLLICVFLGACAATQNKTRENTKENTQENTDAPLSQKTEPSCGSECGNEDDANRYQYYLGILSVFLFG